MKNMFYFVSLFVLFVVSGCATQASGQGAVTPANAEKSIEIQSPDGRLLEEMRQLRQENAQLRLAQNGGQGRRAQPPSLMPASAGPSASIVGDGTGVTRYDPLFSPMIPSRTVYLPGEIDHFVSFEGQGGWAPCMGYENVWHPVNLNGRPVMALTGEMRGCIVATDCPQTDPRGVCVKQLTIYWLERSNPTWVVEQRTVTIRLQRRPMCASIGNGCTR